MTKTTNKDYVTPVKPQDKGFGFDMSPGVTILVLPHGPESAYFAKGLADIIQRVARDEWV